MEGSVLEVSLSIKRMKSEKGYRKSLLAVIVPAIIALLNSYGGNLNLKFEDNAVLKEEDVDGVLRRIEQRLVDTIGRCTFNSKVKTPQVKNSRVTKQLVLVVERVKSLCTVNYNLYLPTRKQVTSILPSESSNDVKDILNREVHDRERISSVEFDDFVLNKEVPFTESHSIQFKYLKDEKSKCVSLADRMTNKSNKLDRYISAFANDNGGSLYYGIASDGVIKGETTVEGKIQEEIVRKVSKVINQMNWGGGELERGKHWDIQFVPVKDENNDEIPSLFVIMVSVAPLPGGLFTSVPETYHVVHGRVEKMSFAEWKRRLFIDEQPTKVMVPSFVGRTQWKSVETQIICHKVLEPLLKYQNDGDSFNFEKCAARAKQNYKDRVEVKSIILAERSACAYKKGAFQKAKSLLETFEKGFSTQPVDEVFVFRAVYAKSAIARAAGDYQEIYDIHAQEGLQLAERVPAGVFTAWFYNHVAMVEKHLSQQPKEAERAPLLVQSAKDHFIKALQHAQASSVEQKFSITIADLQQRIHISRAITSLGTISSGANFRKVTLSDIREAETDLSIYHTLVVQGNKETNYRKIYYILSMSDLRMCQWWQQLQTQEQRSSENGTPYLLKEAFDYATEAKELSMKYYFEQLTNYANNRLAVIIEVLIKLKVSSLRRPRNINNDQ